LMKFVTMKISAALSVMFIALLLISCGSKDYSPSSHLTPKEEYDNVWKIIRYIGRAPENLTMPERFYNGYDDHYKEQMSLHRLDAYYIEGDTHYFLISRQAPSLVEKRVATGGKMKLDEKGDVVEYEEVFRTWKMPDSLQVKKSIFLFDKMVKGESLEPYLTKNSTPEEYIEFPDDNTYYDRGERTWKNKLAQ
jgi:hypothetical protein